MTDKYWLNRGFFHPEDIGCEDVFPDPVPRCYNTGIIPRQIEKIPIIHVKDIWPEDIWPYEGD